MTTRTGARHADLYSLPEIYDILHAPGTRDEAAAVLRIARAHGLRGPLTLLEPACGTARHLRVLAALGHTVIGFDKSRAMIREAKRLMPPSARATLFTGDMARFAHRLRPSSVHAAFNLINTIRHLDRDAQMLAHLAGLRDILVPNGIAILGVSLCAYGLERETEDVWTGRRGPCRVTQVVQYLPPSRRERRERVVSHLTIDRNGRTHHVDSAYHLRSYNLAQWRRVLDRARFRVIRVVDQDGRDTPPVEPGYALWVTAPEASRSTKSRTR